MNKITPAAIVFLTALGTQGCNTIKQPQALNDQRIYPQEGVKTTSDREATNIPSAHSSRKEDDVEAVPVVYRQFPIDALYDLIVAELAASRQQFDLTLDNYVHQANVTNDKQIIARAARIAQYFRAQQESLDMGIMWLKHEPNNIEAISLVANAWLELGDPKAALVYAERLFPLTTTTEGDQDIGALIETIANFSKQSDSKQVMHLTHRLTELQAKHPQLVGIKVGLSILHQIQGHLEKASHWIQQALLLEPDRTSAVVQEARLLQQTGQAQLAADKLKIQLDKTPGNNRLRLVYARLLTQIDINEAYQQFTQLSKQSPNQLDLKFSRALIAAELKEVPVAKKLLEELLAVDYRPDTTRFYLGHTYELQQQFKKALQQYLAIKQGDNFLPAQNRAGRLLIKQGELEQAGVIFAILRQNYPEKRQQLYVNESNILLQSKYYDRAQMLLTEGIQHFPDNTSLRYNRSTVYEKKNMMVLMESDLRHVLTLDPENVNALNGLGYFLATRTHRYQEALALIKKALAIRPQDAAIIDSMGWVTFKLGRIDESLAYLRKAFSIFPDPEVAAHLGEVLWFNGKRQEALEIWNKSLKKYPDSLYIRETMERLNASQKPVVTETP